MASECKLRGMRDAFLDTLAQLTSSFQSRPIFLAIHEDQTEINSQLP